MVDSSATRSASCQVMAEIRDLGRLPNSMKRPVGDAQIAEKSLANRLRKARAKQQEDRIPEEESGPRFVPQSSPEYMKVFDKVFFLTFLTLLDC